MSLALYKKSSKKQQKVSEAIRYLMSRRGKLNNIEYVSRNGFRSFDAVHSKVNRNNTEEKLCVAVHRRQRWFGSSQNNAWLHTAFTSALNKIFILGLVLGKTSCKVPIAIVVLSTFLHRFVLSRVMWRGCVNQNFCQVTVS